MIIDASSTRESAFPAFLEGGGEMGQLLRSTDWSTTPLGEPTGWPQPLRTCVRIMLDSPFGMYIAWGKEYIQLYNDGYRPILGATKHPQAIGNTTRETFAEIWDTIGPMFESVMQGNAVGFQDFSLHLNRNGFMEECFFDFSYSPIRQENGEVGGVLVTVVETTDKVHAAKALKESEQQLKFAVEAAQLGTWDFNPATNKFKGNDRLKKWFGIKLEEEIDLSIAISVIAEGDRKRVTEAIQAALQYDSGGNYDITYSIINPQENKERIVRAMGKVSFDERGIAYRFNGTLQDVTEETVAKRQFAKSNAQLRKLVQYAPVAMCVLRGPTFIVELANERVLEIWGKTADQMLNKPIFEAMPDAASQGFEEFLTGVYTTGKSFAANELPIDLVRYGIPEKAFLNFVYEPLYEDDDTISGIVAVATEVTEQVNTRKKVEEKEEQLRIALEAGELGTFDFHPQTGKLICSDKTKELFGFPPFEEISYKSYLLAVHPGDRERIEAEIDKAIRSEADAIYEMEYRTIGVTDGRLRWIRSKGKLGHDKNGNVERLTGIVQDITKNKELIQSLQLQSLVLSRMDEGVSVTDENGFILFTNPAEDAMFGYNTGELIGKHVTVQNAYDEVENKRIVDDVVAQLKELGFWSGEWHNRKKDGTHFFTRSFLTSMVVDGNMRFVCVQRDITNEKAAQEILNYRTALLEAQNETIPDAILIVDGKGKMISFNTHFVQLWQVPQAIIAQKDDEAALESAMNQLVDPTGFIERVKYYYNHPEEKSHEEILFKDGRIVERYGNAVLGQDGTSYGWAWYFRDVTERRQVEETIIESESRFRSLADDSPMFVFIIDPNEQATINYWNKTWLNYTGQTMEEAIGRAWDGIIHPDDVSEVLDIYVPQFEKRESYYIPAVRVKRYDGEYRWHMFKGNPRYTVDGVFKGYVGVGFDIHEQQVAEEALKESEERFRSLSNSIPQLAWMADTAGSIYWYNQRWYDYTGTTFNDMKGWGWQAVHHPDLVEKVKVDYANAIATGKPYEGTFLIRSKDGEFRWFLTRAVPVRNAEGQIVQWFGTNTDVSAQREVEQALKGAKEQLEVTFQNVPSAIYHFDKEGKMIYLNEKAAHQMGYESVEEILAEKDMFQFRKRLDETFIVLDEEGNQLSIDQSSVALTLKTKKPTEIVTKLIHRTTGEFIWLLSSSSPLFHENGEISMVLTTSTDITLQKTSEQTVRESENRFRTLAETLPQMIWVRRMDGVIEYYSKSWEKYSGIKDIREAWTTMTHPDDWGPIMAKWQNATSTGTAFQYEARLRNKEGEYRWHYAVGEPVRDELGRVVKYIGSLTDIHVKKSFAEKLAELVKERTADLERSNEDLQQFAHVASHDLKEPLRKIKTFGSRLLMEQGDGLTEKAKMYLGKMEISANRMYDMIDGVLLYSSLNAREQLIEEVDLNLVLENVREDLEILIQQKESVLQFSNLPKMIGSRILLHQLFYNLVNNSLKFSDPAKKGIISIRSRMLSMEEVQLSLNKPVADKYVQIDVEDNGIGFNQNQATKIFKTFTRLNSKDEYEGTGLGLSLCKKIVERHHGAISAVATEGEGATFFVILPLNAMNHSERTTLAI